LLDVQRSSLRARSAPPLSHYAGTPQQTSSGISRVVFRGAGLRRIIAVLCVECASSRADSAESIRQGDVGADAVGAAQVRGDRRIAAMQQMLVENGARRGG